MMIEGCSKECCVNNKRWTKRCQRVVVRSVALTIKDKQNDDRELQ